MSSDEVCEKLDSTLFRLMESLKELSSLRNRYQELVKEGYFAMSQARHAMGGPGRVSPTQYDSTMKALVRLELDPAFQDGELESESFHAEFKVHRIKPGSCVQQTSPSSLENAEGVVRRRKGEESIEDVTPLAEQEGVASKGEEVKDPIRWFGILVPQNLRRSQQCFVEAVNLCAELAAAQVRVQHGQRQYQELLAKKQQLTSS